MFLLLMKKYIFQDLLPRDHEILQVRGSVKVFLLNLLNLMSFFLSLIRLFVSLCNVIGHGADGQLSVGKEMWLFQSKLNNGVRKATVDVLSYSNGRSNHLEVECPML